MSAPHQSTAVDAVQSIVRKVQNGEITSQRSAAIEIVERMRGLGWRERLITKREEIGVVSGEAPDVLLQVESAMLKMDELEADIEQLKRSIAEAPTTLVTELHPILVRLRDQEPLEKIRKALEWAREVSS